MTDRILIDALSEMESTPESDGECRLPHRQRAAARLITGTWGDWSGVNFCFGCGQSLEGAGE